MRLALVLAASVSLGLVLPAEAKVKIAVDLDSQTMHVEAGDKTYDWDVSSGRRGYETPIGTYGVLWMDKDHRSEQYDNAPMPNAIFFTDGYAIHGSYRSPFGRPASHGCVRLPPAKAALLFGLVKAQGAEITITGDGPAAGSSESGPSQHRDISVGLTARDPLAGIMVE